MHSRDLRHVVEVLVTSEKDKLVLKGEGGNPDIVGRNRRSLRPQLTKELSVVMGRIEVRQSDTNPTSMEKSMKRLLVCPGTRTYCKTRSEFGDHDQREMYLICPTEHIDRNRIAFAEIAVSVRVDQNPHFHKSGSIRSCSSRARSTSGSATQLPARSSRS